MSENEPVMQPATLSKDATPQNPAPKTGLWGFLDKVSGWLSPKHPEDATVYGPLGVTPLEKMAQAKVVKDAMASSEPTTPQPLTPQPQTK